MKILAILMGLALVAFCLPASAEVLNDSQLDKITAGDVGDIDVVINDLGNTVEYSAVAAQSNIAGVVAGGLADKVVIGQTNNATVDNQPSGNSDSAVALQNNMGVIATLDGGFSIANSSITNSNIATVTNDGGDNSNTTGVQGSSIDVVIDVASGVVNDVDVKASAIAAQNNIAALVDLGATISNSSMSNSNNATVTNTYGNSAAALQNNIAAAVAPYSTIDGLTVSNSNNAGVVNNYAEVAGGINAESLGMTTTAFGGNINGDINSVLCWSSAVAAQSNLAAAVAGVNAKNVTISNSNLATVTNQPL